MTYGSTCGSQLYLVYPLTEAGSYQVPSLHDAPLLQPRQDQPLQHLRSPRRYISRLSYTVSHTDSDHVLTPRPYPEQAIGKIKERLRAGYAFDFQVRDHTTLTESLYNA